MNVPGLAWRVAGTGLRRAMCWRSCVMNSTGSMVCVVVVRNSPGILNGSPYTISADDVCRSALNKERIPRRTRGSASVQCWSVWHMMAAFRARWKRSTSPLAAG
jgi:hypothetical protein